MRFRALHLAGVLLLLTSLGTAEGAAPRNTGYAFGAHYLGMLLAQQQAAQAAIASETPLRESAGKPSTFALPTRSVAQHSITWTMRPPAAHSLHTQAVTSFAV